MAMVTGQTRVRTIILGAAGRDFHNFNLVYRGDPATEVVAFTAQQIPHIDDRRYPPVLAGPLYPQGIPIRAEDGLEALIAELGAERCVMAYSDVSYDDVMHLASRCNAADADFVLLGADRTMIRSKLPVVAVCAVRTGVGKSQTARAVARILRHAGLQVGILRHPMPYGDLAAQRVQRFASEEDLVRHKVTIEEREEYEPHIAAGSVIWAGADYGAIVDAADDDADVLLWDGGNNDTTFLKPTLLITLVDPRPFAVGEIAETFARYPGLGPLLPAMGYGDAQIRDLETTIANAAAAGVEAVAIGTPIDLARLVRIPLPFTRVRYELEVLGEPTLESLLEPVIRAAGRTAGRVGE
jgi:predicted GTPase